VLLALKIEIDSSGSALGAAEINNYPKFPGPRRGVIYYARPTTERARWIAPLHFSVWDSYLFPPVLAVWQQQDGSRSNIWAARFE